MSPFHLPRMVPARIDLLRRQAGRNLRRLATIAASLCIVLGFSLALRAQLTVPETAPQQYAGFEGRHVSEVNISANPSVDLKTIRALIRQKAGMPFSTSAIQQSIAALQGTKRFSKVEISVDFAPSGLDILFILQPTSYVGILSFPGANGSFPYVRLLQAANISAQTPYFAQLLPQGRSGLLGFLRQEGYFRATVHPEIVRDDPHRVVNLVFRTDPGKRAEIGKIAIEGISPQQSSKILRGLGSVWSKLKGRSLTSGRSYDPDRIRKASDYILAQIRKGDRLAATIRQRPAEYHPESNRADIAFIAQPGPVVLLRASGAKVSAKTLRREVPIEKESIINEAIADQGGENLVIYFQAKGYFDAQVRTQYQEGADQVRILYGIQLGKRYRVANVVFTGNRHFDEDRLHSVVSVEKRRSILGFPITRGKFSQTLVDQSVSSLRTLYNQAGFAGVAIEPHVRETGNAVRVTFAIREGPQDRVGKLAVEGNRTVALSRLSAGKPLNLGPGKPYSANLLERDRNQILASYFNLGYLDATLQAKATPAANDPHVVNVVYSIHEGLQGRISTVLPLGEKMTRPDFIRDALRTEVRPGAPLSEGNFLAAESDLYNLGIFDWVSVNPLQPSIDQTHDELLVKVHESKRYTMDIGAGIEIIPRSGNVPVGTVALPGLPIIGLGSKFSVSQKSFFGPRFSFALARHNMLGRAETATFSTVLSRLDQSGLFTYADPRFWGLSWRSLFSISGERTTENPLYTAVLSQASFQVEKALEPQQTNNLIFRYSFDHTNLSNILIPDLVLPQDRSVRLSTFSAEYLRDTRDNALDAHRGMFQTINVGLTPTALGSTANFTRVLLQNAVYVPVQPWLTWATNLRLGFAIPFAGSAVPLSERFFSGGADSLRGFPINGAGPQRPVQVCSNPSDSSTCSLISVPVGGDMLFILNSEARFPIVLLKNLGGALFYDGGNVYKNINFRQWANDYTNTLGVGLRYKTPVGPIRFDVGYRLTPVPGVRALQYFVTVGQSF